MSVEASKIAEALTANEWTHLFDVLRRTGSLYSAAAAAIEKRDFETFKKEISKMVGEDAIFLMSALQKIAVSVDGTAVHFREYMHGLVDYEGESSS